MVNGGPAVITATANPATAEYGQAIPVLTGTLTGALPQVADGLVVAFTTTAGLLSPVGSYPIVATLSGPASATYTRGDESGLGSVADCAGGKCDNGAASDTSFVCGLAAVVERERRL